MTAMLCEECKVNEAAFTIRKIEYLFPFWICLYNSIQFLRTFGKTTNGFSLSLLFNEILKTNHKNNDKIGGIGQNRAGYREKDETDKNIYQKRKENYERVHGICSSI